ncbi:MAG: toll/interleukin-1 receptor domain-containing protein [Saprospiraceae bacterium]|nr:toll/interleukin-1 receptor domain-containing protein [Saprospiraceae bacterium]
MNTNQISTLIAEGKLEEALEALLPSQPAAAILLGDFRRGQKAYNLNTIGYDEWNRIQSRLAQAVLELLEKKADLPMKTMPTSDHLKTMPTTHKLFLSYSHQDEELKNKLATHLAPLRRSGKVAVWQDRQILPGTEWDAAIKAELAEADIILLLVSAEFIASEYIWKYEIAGAMERHDRREATVIPIIVRPCEWHDMPFAKVQALPRNAKPVTTYANQDEAWLEVVQGIKRVVEN